MTATPTPTSPVEVIQADREAWIVTSQDRPEWPSKSYRFRHEGQARMFIAMLRRDGVYRADMRGIPA